MIFFEFYLKWIIVLIFTVEFYKGLFGLRVVTDFGANKTLSLQTLETYKDFINTDEISFVGNNFEIYFEEDDFDKFIDKLKNYDIKRTFLGTAHGTFIWSWQTVGENIKVVCRRFLDSGMTPE